MRTTSTFNRNETGGFNLLKKQMMDAQSYGYAVHELVWKPTGDGELRCEFIQVPLWHFENRTGQLRFLPTTTSYEGVNMKPGEWMVTTADAMNRRLFARYLEHAFPGRPVAAEFRLLNEKKPSASEVADLAGKLKAAGWSIDRDELQEAVGYTLVKDETEKTGGENRWTADGMTSKLPFLNKASTQIQTTQNASGREDVLAAFSKDSGPAAEAVKQLLENSTPESAAALLKNLPNLLPDDPALAAVIAEAMAGKFAVPVANKKDQLRGKTSPDSTPGSFAPAGGGEGTESKKVREKREKAERQAKHMAQGVVSMPEVLAGHDVKNFMPRFKNERVSYSHIAFYQDDMESGYIHIKNHSADKNGVFNHQAMLVGDKIPETIAKGTWYDDGEGIRVVYNDRIVALGKDGDGLKILSAYEAADKAKRTRTDNRFVRLMNKFFKKMFDGEGAI